MSTSYRLSWSGDGAGRARGSRSGNVPLLHRLRIRYTPSIVLYGERLWQVDCVPAAGVGESSNALLERLFVVL